MLKKENALTFSIRLLTNRFSKFLLEKWSRLRQQQQAHFELSQSAHDYLDMVRFSGALAECHLVSSYARSRTAGYGSRSGSCAPAVLLIKCPKVMLNPLPGVRTWVLHKTSRSQNKSSLSDCQWGGNNRVHTKLIWTIDYNYEAPFDFFFIMCLLNSYVS